MSNHSNSKSMRAALAAALLITVLSACSGGGGGNTAAEAGNDNNTEHKPAEPSAETKSEPQQPAEPVELTWGIHFQAAGVVPDTEVEKWLEEKFNVQDHAGEGDRREHRLGRGAGSVHAGRPGERSRVPGAGRPYGS
ncbi:hypothetical protein [Paenibacillus antri]|uniref:hypothetical protein n=1 Tax=Paenibacillus antri TaxID=2582848 RepID=UPI0013053B51|nr:hypothetical protein [Paenibacillus antri]